MKKWSIKWDVDSVPSVTGHFRKPVEKVPLIKESIATCLHCSKPSHPIQRKEASYNGGLLKCS